MGASIPIITAVAGLIGAGATAYAVTQRPRRPERVPMVPPPDIDQVTDDASREVEKKRRRAGRAATLRAKEVTIGKLSLHHVERYNKMLEESGIGDGHVSPVLLPDYVGKIG